MTSRVLRPRELLYSLTDNDSATTYEDPRWEQQIKPAVLDGSLTRGDVLGALNWTSRQFSAAVTHVLHQNFMSHMQHLNGAKTGDPERWASFHQEWAARYGYLQLYITLARMSKDMSLYLGVKELVTNRRAVNAGMVKDVEPLIERCSPM